MKLRALVAADAVPAAQALQDPEVVRWLEGWARRPYSADDFLEFINRRRVDAVTWAIECVEDGEFVGATGLHELDFRNRHCFWGIWIGPSTRWDRGYGSEACRLCMQYAFDELGMEKVYLHVYEGNHRGRRAYEKAGFELEGTLPRDHLQEGSLITTHLMAAYRDNPLYVREAISSSLARPE